MRRTIGRGKPINLVVGGYVKGESAESLEGRKHEIYSLSLGWENQERNEIMISYGFKCIKRHLIRNYKLWYRIRKDKN